MRLAAMAPCAVRRGFALGVLLAGTASEIGAQTLALSDRGPRFLLAVASRTKPVEIDARSSTTLRRVVSLSLNEPTVGQLLASIERQTGLKFAFDRQLVPVAQPVSLRAEAISVEAALTAILSDTDVDVLLSSGRQVTLIRRRPTTAVVAQGTITGRVTDSATMMSLSGAVVALDGTTHRVTTGSDGRYRITGIEAGSYTARARYIGYAPMAAAVTVSDSDEVTVDFALRASAQKLDEVVTTGTIVPTEVKALPTPISIVSATEIEQQNLVRVDQVFRGTIPGAISFDQGANDYASRVLVRGANTIYAFPSIKTYINGIEVANPLFIATIDPRSIERIEVTRGPQASTVYGSDASGGVMQIFTKTGTAETKPEFSARAAVGAMQGQYSSGLPLRQDYSMAVTGGAAGFSYSVDGSYMSSGAWTPDYFSRSPSLTGTFRVVQGNLTADLTARYAAKTFAFANSPALSNLTFYSRPSFSRDVVEQQTYGLGLSYLATPRWQHNLILGFDGSAYGYHNTQARLTTPADTFLIVSNSNVKKASVRYNNAVSMPLGPSISSTFTSGLEYYNASAVSDYTGNATRTTGNIDGDHFVTDSPWDNTGFFGQVQVGVRDALFITGGLRGESSDKFGSDYGIAWSPRIGASFVHRLGPASVKWRAAYGNAIRGVEPSQKDAVPSAFQNQFANPLLGPERQEGWDAGVEAYFGDRITFGVTYYDQTAKDLIDQVYLDTQAAPPVVQFQNVGEIKNKGWEFEATWSLGKLGFGGTYSRSTSTVRRLGPTYTGDLVPGDQLLDVPKNTAGASVTFAPLDGMIMGGQLLHIGAKTGTDVIPLLGFFYGGDPYRGSGRDYWITYPSVTKFNLSVAQRLTQRFTAFVQVDNVGNNQRFEQDNATPPLGRVTTVGARFRY